MALLKLSIGAVLLAFVTFIGRTEAYCNYETVERCLAPLTELPTHNRRVSEEQFSTTCNGLSSNTTCLRQGGCSMTDPWFASVWKGLTDGMEYLCGEGREVFMRGHSCMVPQSYQDLVGACNVAYVNAVTANVYAFCPATNDFTECTRRALYTSCTPEFAVVFLKSFKLSTSPVIALISPDCRIDFFGTNTVRNLSHRLPRSVLVNDQYTKETLKFLGESDQNVFMFISTAPGESLLNQMVDDAVNAV